MTPGLPRALALVAALIAPLPVLAQTAVVEVRSNPGRFVNREITLVGRVLRTEPTPAGTTRGLYSLVDDTDPQGVIVRSRDLPPVGREVAVTGTWLLDPTTGVYLLDERDRRDAGGRRAPLVGGGGGGGGGGGSSVAPVLLWGGAAAVGVAALVALVVLLGRRSAPAAGSAPAAPAPAAPPLAPAPPAARPAGNRVELRLELQEPGGAARTVTIRTAPATVGRDPDCDLSLSDPEVSRRHAEVVVEGGRLWLVDRGSTHGLVAGGRRVERVELGRGTQVQLGKSRLRVV